MAHEAFMIQAAAGQADVRMVLAIETLQPLVLIVGHLQTGEDRK